MAADREQLPPAPLEDKPESLFQEVVVFLWGSKWILMLGLLIGLGLGIALFRVTPKVYESSAKFIIDELPFNIREESTDAETERQLVQTLIMSIPSRDMRIAVAKRLGVSPSQIVFEDIDQRIPLSGPIPAANVRVASTKNSRIGAITARSQDVAFAAEVPNAVLQELQALNVIAGELKTVRQNMKLSRDKADQLLKQLVDITAQRIEIEKQVMELDDYLKRNQPLEGFPSFSQDTTLNNLKTQMILVDSEYQSIAASSTRGVRLEGKKAELQGLRIQLTSQARTLATALRSRLAIARTQEEDFQKQVKEIQAQISSSERRGARFLNSFSDPAKIHQIIAEETIQPSETGNVIVTVDMAKEEKRNVQPKLVINLVLGGMLGAGLGLGVALLRASLDTRIRSVDQVGRQTGRQFLASIPPISRKQRKSGSRIVDTPPPSQGLGFLRNFLLRSNLNKSTSQILALVPASKGVWSSRLVSDLAVLLAQAEKRTLVIDLHSHNPQQAKLLGIEAKTGWSEWLTSDATLDKFISYSVVRELALLDVGPAPKHLDELLSRRPLSAALTDLLVKWDFILIDTPQLREDWNLLLALPPAASFIAVAGYRNTEYEDLRRLIRQAEGAGWSFLGTVVQNDPAAK